MVTAGGSRGGPTREETRALEVPQYPAPTGATQRVISSSGRRCAGLWRGLAHDPINVRRAYIWKQIDEHSADGFTRLGPPEHPAFAGRTATGDAQHELIRDTGGIYASDLRAQIGNITDNARPPGAAIDLVNRCRRIPLNPQSPASLASHWLASPDLSSIRREQ